MLNSLLIGVGAIVGIVVVALVIILVIAVVVWWIKTANALVRLNNKAEEAWATIDVFLKKRYDLIPNLVETVKGYAKHESETLTNVVAARNAAGAANALNSSLKVLLNAVQEAYPELKADANFRDLQEQLKSLEGELESARRYYNGVVKSFNNKIQVFPSSIVANKKGYEKKKYFELDSEEERKNVKVSF